MRITSQSWISWAIFLTSITLVPANAFSQDDDADAGFYVIDKGDEAFGIRSLTTREGYLEAASTIGVSEDEATLRAALTRLESLVMSSPDPDRFLGAYNIACAHAKLGDFQNTFDWLDIAYDWGYGVHRANLENIQKDPDLKSIREDSRFEALIKRMVARFEKIRKQWPETKKPYVRIPNGLEPESLAPACVLFHDYGEDKEATAEKLFGAIADELGMILIAPQGPNLIAPKRYGWYATDGEYLERYRIVSKNVWRDYQQVLKEYPIDRKRVFVAGFGQGATMAFPFALRNPQLFAGFLGISGDYWMGALSGGWAKMSGKMGLGVCLIEGSSESQQRLDLTAKTASRLQEEGVKVHRIRHSGQGIPDQGMELVVDAYRWLLGKIGQGDGG